jgi:hypothetical protein
MLGIRGTDEIRFATSCRGSGKIFTRLVVDRERVCRLEARSTTERGDEMPAKVVETDEFGYVLEVAVLMCSQHVEVVAFDADGDVVARGTTVVRPKAAKAVSIVNDAVRHDEVELLRALATFETNALEGRALMLQYIDDYPTAKSGLLNCYIAESYYYTSNYDLACTWFAKSDIDRLQQEHRDRARLYYALSMQECGKEEEGKAMLLELAATSKTRGDDAVFHLAVADYDKGNLDEAYNGFKKVELRDKYYLEVPYYIAGIYLKQGKVSSAKDIATRFIADHGNKPQGTKMQQKSGAAEYALGNYA